MTVVKGDIRLVTNEPAAVSQVWVRAPKPRTQGLAYVSESSDTVQVDNGVVEFTALPGAAIMVLVQNGVPTDTVKLIVPDKDTASLRECIDAVGLVDDGTLSALEELALETARIAAQIASAGQLETWATETATAATEAKQAKGEADSAANRAAGHESNTKQSEANAKQYELKTRQHELDAQSAAGRAASVANYMRGEFESVIESASGAADSAATSAEEAKTAETNSKTHEDNALSAAERAEFAAEETIQQVEGDFATRNYVDASAWTRGVVGTSVTSIDELAFGSWGVASTTVANNLNLPFTQGTLQISRISSGKTVIGVTNSAGLQSHELWMTSISGGVVAPWEKVFPVAASGGIVHGVIPPDTESINDLEVGEWGSASTTTANKLGLPFTLGTLKILPVANGKTVLGIAQQSGLQSHELWMTSISGGVVAPWVKVSGSSGTGGAPGLKTVGVTLTAGSALNGTAGRCRVLAQVTAPVTRWRVHIESRRQVFTSTSDFTLGEVSVGTHTGNGEVTESVSLKSGTTNIAGSSEWVSQWITHGLTSETLVDFEVSGSGLYAYQAAAYRPTGSGWESVTTVPAAVWIEVETYSETPVVALIGDSTGAGQGAARPVHDSALHVAARKHGFIPMNYSYPGSTMQSMTNSDHHIYKRWAHLSQPDSVIIQSGSNDIHGGTATSELQTRFENLVKLARGISPVVFGATVKARYPNSGDFAAALTSHNAYVKTQPAGTRDYLDFYQAVSPNGTVASADAADGAHLSTSGHAKLASAFDSVQVARPPAVSAADVAVKADKSYVDQLVPVGMFSGTGPPEGRVTAPVGSVYTDSVATNGAIRWVKTIGTGNTGWVVEYGDTGIRDISNMLTNATGSVTIARIGQVVYLDVKDVRPTEELGSGTTYLSALPVGFRPSTRRDFGVPTGITSTDARSSYQFSTGAIGAWLPSTSDRYYFQHYWITSNPWPTSLPGTPA